MDDVDEILEENFSVSFQGFLEEEEMNVKCSRCQEFFPAHTYMRHQICISCGNRFCSECRDSFITGRCFHCKTVMVRFLAISQLENQNVKQIPITAKKYKFVTTLD